MVIKEADKSAYWPIKKTLRKLSCEHTFLYKKQFISTEKKSEFLQGLFGVTQAVGVTLIIDD